MRISGHATATATEAYAERQAEELPYNHFREAAGWMGSSIGIGTYLGAPDDETDNLVTRAVGTAVVNGVNVIDTAVNYRFERAERAVGKAISTLISSGQAKREELIICSKGGYIPNEGGSRWFMDTYVRDRECPIRKPDLVGGSHCMHPEYLADQLNQSRRNLGVDTIDVYYIHNPEEQINALSPDAFYGRLKDAFAFLEEAADDGKIQYYGISTWDCLRVRSHAPGNLSLMRARKAAIEAAGDRAHDRFRFVQLPFSLGMSEGLTLPNQNINEQMVAAIPGALAVGLVPVASASIMQGQVGEMDAQLAERLGDHLEDDYQRALQFTRSTPGIFSALVGMKDPAHVALNLELCLDPPLDMEEFMQLFQD